MTGKPPSSRRAFDTRLAAYCVVVRDGSILLALWDMRSTRPEFAPRWTLPGGGVELGESIEDGAVREVAEETGYEVRLTGLLGVDSGHVPAAARLGREGRPLQTVAVMYSAQIVGGGLRHEVGGTTSEAAWFPLEELSRLERTSRVDQAIALYEGARG
ncbi:NUDIX hydrolase [Zafaria sp. Z1313]|uniref:NUDIX hydrolase n=1 Tax=Zafaria sp. Z1313 TaxID=3423202 RepID=UPI003D3021AB